MRIPLKYQNIIKQFIKQYNINNYVIAGGFCRDFYVGRDFSDIDIYVEKFTGEGFVESNEYNSNSVLHIIETGKIEFKDVIFNVIMIDRVDADTIVKSFDLNLSKAYLDENLNIVTTPEFLWDVENKKVTINPDIHWRDLQKIIKYDGYLDKILEYFGWLVSNPQIFKDNGWENAYRIYGIYARLADSKLKDKYTKRIDFMIDF